MRAIFFDAVGTLIHPEPPAAAVYWTIGQRFGSRLTQADIAARFTAAFRMQEEIDRQRDWVTSEKREYQRWQDIVGTVLDDVTDLAAAFTELYEHFKKPTSWRCEPSTAPLLEKLRESGIRIGLASNFDGRLRGLVQEIKPLQIFATEASVVISSEVGYRKPAPEFYAAMCRAAGLEAAEILYVGDDPINDYDGAKAAGLRAVLFDPSGKHAARAMESIAALDDL